MRRSKAICVSMLIILAFGLGLCTASWTLEGQRWNFPYHQGELFVSQLSVALQPSEHVTATVSLPMQYIRDSQEQEVQLLYPHLTLAWSIPWGNVHSANIKAAYQLQPSRIQMEGGVQLLFDPLALRAALSYQEQSVTLLASVVFAVNEGWALGTHLQYTKSSVLTYEIIHTSKKGKHQRLSFSHSIDGSMQSLGFEIAL